MSHSKNKIWFISDSPHVEDQRLVGNNETILNEISELSQSVKGVIFIDYQGAKKSAWRRLFDRNKYHTEGFLMINWFKGYANLDFYGKNYTEYRVKPSSTLLKPQVVIEEQQDGTLLIDNFNVNGWYNREKNHVQIDGKIDIYLDYLIDKDSAFELVRESIKNEEKPDAIDYDVVG